MLGMAFLLGVGALLQTEPSEAAVQPVTALPDLLAARRKPAVTAESRTRHNAPSGFDEATYAAGDGARALAQFKDAVDRNPDNAQALTSLGLMLVRLQRTEEALPHLHRAIALEPNKATYRVNLANALAQLNRLKEAVEAYREAQRIQPSDPITAFHLAATLQKMGEYAAAVEAFQKAISLDRADAGSRLGLARSYDALNRWPEAIEAYNAYLQLAPSAPDAHQVRTRIGQLTTQP